MSHKILSFNKMDIQQNNNASSSMNLLNGGILS
jgi:hypothetical protein